MSTSLPPFLYLKPPSRHEVTISGHTEQGCGSPFNGLVGFGVKNVDVFTFVLEQRSLYHFTRWCFIEDKCYVFIRPILDYCFGFDFRYRPKFSFFLFNSTVFISGNFGLNSQLLDHDDLILPGPHPSLTPNISLSPNWKVGTSSFHST